jgi:glycosyltransferase involved in cell wall biosynthesis
MRPKLSVCITTYNRAALLDRTLETVAAQTRVPDELIVSDDGSLDDTPKVAERWKGSFPAFRYCRNERNLNMPGNLNAAIGACTGEYVANLHDGDAYDPTLFEKWEAALDRHPSAGFVFCALLGWPVKTRHGGGVLRFDIAPFTKGREFFESHLLASVGCPVWGTVMARRSAYDRLLPFDASFGFLSDVDMWMRMCLDHDVAYVDEPLILLDHTPSRERVPGRYNWNWLVTVRRIHRTNIDRFFASDPDRRRRALLAHRRLFDRYLVARLLGRLRAGDLSGLREGFTAARSWDPPLRWIGDALG